MAVCPPKQGVLAETSGWNKLVEKLRTKYKENAEKIAEFAFFQKGDMPTFEEAEAFLSKGEKKSLSNTVKSKIDDMFKEGRKKSREMLGYNSGIAQGTLGGEIAGKRVGRMEGIILGKKEMQNQIKELQKEMSDKLKAYLETNEQLVGKLSAKQVNSIVKKSNEIGYSEAKYKKLTEYVDKVIANENYQSDLDNGSVMQKKLKSPFADAARLIKRMKGIDLSELTQKELIDFNYAANEFISSKSPIGSSKYKPFDVNAIDPIISKIESGISNRAIERVKESYDVLSISKSEADFIDQYMKSEDQDAFFENLEEAQKKALRYNLNNIAEYSILGLKEKMSADAVKLEEMYGKEFIERINKITDLNVNDIISPKQLVELTRIIDNIITNNSNAGIRNATSIIDANTGIFKIFKFTDPIVKSVAKSFSKTFYSSAMIFKRIFGDRTAAAAFRAYSGYEQVMNGSGVSDKEVVSAKKSWDAYRKENNIDEDAKTDLIIGIFSRLNNVKIGSETEDFVNEKTQLELSIDKYLKSSNADDNQIGGFLDAIYREAVESAKTHEEFVDNFTKLYPKEVSASKWVAENIWGKFKPQLKIHSQENLNKDFEGDNQIGYHPKTYVNVESESAVAGPSEGRQMERGMKPEETGRVIERKSTNKLPKNKAIDYRFEYNTFKSYKELTFEVASYEAAQTFAYMANIDAFKEIFGGIENSEFIKKMYKSQYEAFKYGRKNVDELSKSMIVSISRAGRNAGTALALGRPTQVFSQATPLFNTLFQNPKYLIKVMSRKGLNNIKLFDYAIIGARGQQMGAMGRAEGAEAISYTKTREAAAKNLYKFSDWIGRNRDRSLYLLAKTDDAVAKNSFLSYYLDYMNNIAKVKTTVDDLPTEHERMDDTRKMALSYAQQAVDETQGSSSREMLSSWSRNVDGGVMSEFVKNSVMPFNNFALNARTRIMEDARKITLGSKAQRAEASKDLVGTFVEAVAYSTVQVAVVSGIYQFGIKKVLSKIFGIEDDETFYESMSGKLKTWYTNITKEMLLSGFGTSAENAGVEAANYFAYKMQQLTTDETGVDYYEWLKDDPTFKRGFVPKPTAVSSIVGNIGGYGIPFDVAEKATKEIKSSITGISETGYVWDKMGKEKIGSTGLKRQSQLNGRETYEIALSEEEKNFYLFLGLANGFSLISGLTDQDIIRAGEKVKYKIEKEESKNVPSTKKAKKSKFNTNIMKKLSGVNKLRLK